jgi:hypothetical protein
MTYSTIILFLILFAIDIFLAVYVLHLRDLLYKITLKVYSNRLNLPTRYTPSE